MVNINDLTEEILHHIISLLSWKDAGRTPILSTQWSYLFHSNPNLILLDDLNEDKLYSDPSFKNFVERVLMSRRSQINKFQLRYGAVELFLRAPLEECTLESIHFPPLERWVRRVMELGIREIDLHLSGYVRSHWLMFHFFTCKTLTVLKLQVDFRFDFNVPENAFPQKLKEVHLIGSFIFCEDGYILRLFSRCPMLQEVEMKGCVLGKISKFNVCCPTLKRLTINCSTKSHYELAIDAPNLIYFDYSELYKKSFKFVNLQSLDEASIHIIDAKDDPSYFTNLMKGISHVHSLHLSGNFLKVIQRIDATFLVWPNLTILRISDSYGPNCLRVLPDLLADAPLLETLVLGHLPPAVEVHLSMLNRLKEIRILSMAGKNGDLETVQYILNAAKVLESFTIHLRSSLPTMKDLIPRGLFGREQVKILKSLMTLKRLILKLPRASEKCQVQVL